MLFANRRTAIKMELVRRILNEDGYRQITRQKAGVGDAVLYCDDGDSVSHVGMIVSRPELARNELGPMKVLSQWGRDGEYVHALEDVHPLLGSPREFWTDRRPTP